MTPSSPVAPQRTAPNPRRPEENDRLAAARCWTGWAAGGLTVLSLAAWLAQLAGRPLAPAAARLVVAAGGFALATYVGSLALDYWLRPRDWRSPRRVLLLLVIVSLAVHLVGIDYELLDHPRSDEGVYYVEAVRINDGKVLPETFNYGHFYYYAPAFVLWVQELFAGPLLAAGEAVYGLESDFAVSRLLLRFLTALLAALTTIPVFWAAFRIAGTFAATVAGLLITFSTLYNSVAHEVICDVPAGFFAAVCFGVTARLLDGETRRDYLVAGVAAGLAAASKYPGGVAALAIFGMWLYWRLRLRRWSWSLFVAAGASIATLLAVMPALWLRSGAVATGQGRDIFFGWRQYALSGWVGVTPESISGYYGQRIVADLGWPAVVVGLTGLALLAARERRRLLAMALFPLGYLVLIGAMSMAVVRNLQPVLPAIAAVLGVGCAGWAAWLHRRRLAQPAVANAALVSLVIAWPVFHTVAWDVSHSRPGTRQQMIEWIEANVPHGAGIAREDYTPELDRRHYLWQHRRFLWRVPEEELKRPEWDYVMLADAAWIRFFPPGAPPADHRAVVAERYEEFFGWPLAAEFRPSLWRSGPRVSLHRIPQTPSDYRTRRRWTAAEVAWVSDEAIRPRVEGGPLAFDRKWQIAVFKDHFAAALYEIKLFSEPFDPEAYVHVVTPDNREVGAFRARRGSVVVALPEAAKYLVRVFQEPGSTLDSLVVRPAPEGAEPTAPLPPESSGA